MKKLLMLLLLCSMSKISFGINSQEVYHLLKKYDIKHSEIVLKQAIHETGNFKSKLCKYKYNLFGFRIGGRYTSFNSYEDCVAYYKQWQTKYYVDNPKSRYYKYYSSNYYRFLQKRGYAEDKKYIVKLKKIKTTNIIMKYMESKNCLDSLVVVGEQSPFLIN